MTQPLLDEIQVGWKVYAGSDEVGEVTDIWHESIDVGRGFLIRHHYRIPADYVAEAGDGKVDLGVDRATVDRLEIGAEPSDDDLPDEFRRLEGRDRLQHHDDPRDSLPFHH
jgi:hypothetical protein